MTSPVKSVLILMIMAWPGATDAAEPATPFPPERYVDTGQVMAFEQMLVSHWHEATNLLAAGDRAGYERESRFAIACLNGIVFSNPAQVIIPRHELATRRVSSDLREVYREILASEDLDRLRKASWFPEGFTDMVARLSVNGSMLFLDAGRDAKQQGIDQSSDLLAGRPVPEEMLRSMAAAMQRLKKDDYDRGPRERLLADIEASNLVPVAEPIANLSEIPDDLLREKKAVGATDVQILSCASILPNAATKRRYVCLPDGKGGVELRALDPIQPGP